MWFTPSATAARSTAMASSRSRGGPKTPSPASCIAPYPMRHTDLSARRQREPACAAVSGIDGRDVEVHAIVVDLACRVDMEDRGARDGDLLAILAAVGDLQLDDGVAADVPFLHDVVMQ